jgi:hypothetical protein
MGSKCQNRSFTFEDKFAKQLYWSTLSNTHHRAIMQRGAWALPLIEAFLDT